MQTFSYRRTGRTTRMLAAAYYEALKGETDPNAPTICVSFTTAAEATRWIVRLEQQFERPLPSKLLLIGDNVAVKKQWPWTDFRDHATMYKEYLGRGVQPWEMHLQSSWKEHCKYDLENTPVEFKRPKFVNPDGTAVYPSIYDLVMQMWVSSGYADGCGSEEHF